MKRKIIVLFVLLLLAFIVWRFIRPMNIFVVTKAFEKPVSTALLPVPLKTLRAEGCAVCHPAFYDEWRTTIHSQAWTDPYFQADWKFDDSQVICRLCHTPLDRQQPYKILGYRDKSKWDPVLENNPDFDAKLQHEGVTCTACHLRDGKIAGVLGDTDAPHPVKKLEDPNQVCVRCHVVSGDRWDTFFRFPPCGTVAEIESSVCEVPDIEELRGLAQLVPAKTVQAGQANVALKRPDQSLPPDIGASGEVKMNDVSSLGCVQCHMPLIKRPLVAGGPVRRARRHLWRGGHDPEMVKKALTMTLTEEPQVKSGQRRFTLMLANTGAAHYVPTGTPDRYLTVQMRLLDRQGGIIEEQNHTLKRTVMWRPFIVDLWDTRLRRWQPQYFSLDVPTTKGGTMVEAVVRYHLMNESRRKRIAYDNKTPISYEVMRARISLDGKPSVSEPLVIKQQENTE